MILYRSKFGMKIAIIIYVMLKRTILILLFFSLVFNCTVTEEPEFLGLDNIKVVDSNIKNITLSADAMFMNPNDVGGTLKTESISIIPK